MRILLVTPYFPPQNAVACLRVHAMAHAWSQRGHEVTVLTTAKRSDQAGLHLPHTHARVIEIPYRVPAVLERLRNQHKFNAADDSQSDHTSTRSWLGRQIARAKQRTGIFSSVRMPDLTDWWIEPALRWCWAERKRFDVVVSSSGPYAAHVVARSIRRRNLADAWLADFRDLWTANHAHSGLFPFMVAEHSLQRQCLREADAITTVSAGLAKSLSEMTTVPVHVIYNGFDQDTPPDPQRQAHPQAGPIQLAYTGTLYEPGQNPLPLLQAMRAAAQGSGLIDVRLVVAGRGAQRWHALAQACGVAQLLDIRGEVARDQAQRLQHQATALVLLDWNHTQRGVLTGKVFEYLHASAPILIIGGSAESEVATLVRRAGRGIHLGNSVPHITQALQALSHPHPFELRRNDAFIATLSRQQQATRMLDIVQSLTQD